MGTRSRMDERSQYIRLAYSSALQDIRFFKRQQVKVTYYSLALYAAIIAIYSGFKNVSSFLLIGLIIVVSAFSVFILCHLQYSLENVRSRKDKVKFKLPPNLKNLFFKRPKYEWMDKNFFFLIMFAIVLTGAALALSILIYFPPK
jgi:hypothetical protein